MNRDALARAILSEIFYDLPSAFKEKLVVLCNEATQSCPDTHTSLSAKESLSLLLSRCADSKGLVYSFLLQSLSALGWNQGELVDKLRAEADATFFLQTSYPNVWRMANDWASEFQKIGLAIQESLFQYYVEVIRLSLLNDIIPEIEGSEQNFHEMFHQLLLKTASPSETASIIYSVLMQCCCICTDDNISKLEPYLIPGFDLCQSYPNIVLKLRIAEFLHNLGEKDCILAMMVYSHLHMDLATDKCSPLGFIRILFQRKKAEKDMLNQLAEWFNKKEYFHDPATKKGMHQKESIPDCAMKCPMEFMIKKHYPTEDEIKRRNEFILQIQQGGRTNTSDRQVGNNRDIEYDPDLLLGQGNSGSYVYSGTYKELEVAVKKINKTLGKAEEKMLLKDVAKHDNIVKYYHIETDREFDYIALELCLTSLKDYVEGTEKSKEKLQGLIVDKKKLLEDSLKGLEHLHKSDIVHRNLKPENILLDRRSQNSKEVKAVLCDYGILTELDTTSTTKPKGLMLWMAPEQIQTQPVKFSRESDIFVMGCVMYFALSNGKHPFGNDFYIAYRNIKANKYTLDYHDGPVAKDLIESMIKFDKSLRPSATEVFQDYVILRERL